MGYLGLVESCVCIEFVCVFKGHGHLGNICWSYVFIFSIRGLLGFSIFAEASMCVFDGE